MLGRTQAMDLYQVAKNHILITDIFFHFIEDLSYKETLVCYDTIGFLVGS